MIKNCSRNFSTGARLLNSSKFESPLRFDVKSLTSNIQNLKSIVQSELNYTLSEEKVEIHPSSNIRFEDRQIYDPFDFSFAKKNLIKSQFHRDVGTNRPFNREGNRKEDVFKKHNINPLDLYTLSSVLRYYVNESGRIYHNNANIGVSQKSQKKLAKAIKRARVNAIMSNVSNITRIREG